MRVIGTTHGAGSRLTAVVAVLGLVAALTDSSAAHAEGHRVAVIDVAFIFKNHEGIKAEVAKIEEELKAFDAEMNARREELQQLANELKTFNVGSKEYSEKEERVASMESRMRLDMARKRKQLSDAEAKIYYENYKRIAEGVKYLAEHYKIDLVLRYNSEEMKPEEGDSVIRSVMKNVVYHDDALDMTRGVMQYLDRSQVARGNADSQSR